MTPDPVRNDLGPELSYDEACRAAATRQGLDPIRGALDAAGIANDLIQSGGWIMLVEVRRADGTWLWINASEYADDPDSDLLMIGRYEGDADEGEMIHEAVTVDEAVRAAREFLDEPHTDADADGGGTYKIVRFRFDADNEVITRGLTLAQAQAHCRRDDTHGDGWFDGYDADEEAT